ncbi:nuclear pore complex protein Nup153 isoform X1 [Arapaima gigas]
MAATGGGKIRTRRYHIASKPYAKGNQQPGLISRMTDTVKSIVPSWLQRYFRNGEAADRDDSVLRVESDSQDPPTRNSEQTVAHEDEQDSPEPSTSNAEPSTSRAALNFQDILARPPLSRSHLHFPSLDGSPGSPFPQPSTSSAPFPGIPFTQPSTSSTPLSGAPFTQPSTSSSHLPGGPTSFSLVKEIKDTGSQHDDDNISTTSGFSSRASDKDVTTSKPTLLPLLWSPENDRSHSGPQQTQAALKKPGFNLSVFGMSSASLNNSVMNSSQLGDSPFYPGKTTYGGAAAARSTARAHPGTPYRAPVRRQVKAKPAGVQACGVTSATARRILLSLERMSSPLADAKRIPSTVYSPLSTSLERTESDSLPFQSKRKKMDPTPPPTQKLLVPATASVTGNRSMSFRPSLTPGGSLGRVMDRRSTRDTVSTLNAQPYDWQKLSTSNFVYPLSSTPAANNVGSGGAGGKMKRERSTRPSSKRAEDEVVEAQELPAISLPITTLPTFSFSSPPPTFSATSATTTPTVLFTSKVPPAASSPPCVPFTFSSPIVKATATSPPSLSPSPSGFTFSAPVSKAAPLNFNGKTDTPVVSPVKSCSGAVESKAVDDFQGPFKPAKVLKQGSVLDLLKAPGFSSSPSVSRTSPGPDVSLQPPSSSSHSTGFGVRPVTGSWNCTNCLVQNSPSESKCIDCNALRSSTDLSSSCVTSKPDSQPTTLSSQVGTTPLATFGALFAPAPGTWECDTCMVQNKPDVIRCVACETAKPGTGVKPGLTLPIFSETLTPPVSSSGSTTVTAPVTSSITSSTSTSSSQSSGVLGFGDKFQKPEGAWECGTCLVENKAQDTKCVTCQSPKPAPVPAPPSSTTSISVPPAGVLLGFGDKFKPAEGSWECQICCVQNKADALQCVACQSNKPGASAPSKALPSSSSSPFKFGIQTSSSTNCTATSSLGGFKFGTSSADTTSSGSAAGSFTFSAASGGFKFGLNSSSTPKPEEDKKAETQGASSGFKFGISGGIVFGTGSGSSNTSTVSNGESKNPTFSFGLAKAEEKTNTASTLGGNSFVFSASKSKPETGGSASTEPAAAASQFTFGKPQETAPTVDQTKAASVLGQTTEKSLGASTLTAAPKPTFTFGKPEEKQDNTTPSTGFLFSNIKETEKTMPTVGFSFTKPDPPKEQGTPAFNFGKPAEKTDPAEPPKVSFSFGVTSTDSGAPKPVFGFMAGSPAVTSSSSSSSSSTSTTTPAHSLFGSSSSANSSGPAPNPSTTFPFGQSASNETAPVKAFVFGQQQDSQPVPSAPQNPPAASAPAAAQPFLFGSGANTAVPSFTFGAAASSTTGSTATGQPPAPFAFPSATSSTAAPPGPAFGVGQTPAFGQSSGQPNAPTFGSSVPPLFSGSASQPPAFGTGPSATPMFGQQANTTPAFGSASTSSAPGGGFQFGGASAFGASGSAGAVFKFSAGPAATAAPSQLPASGRGFNFTQPPMFNIGTTKSSTTSTVGQHSISGRKIKTAVRRRK